MAPSVAEFRQILSNTPLPVPRETGANCHPRLTGQDLSGWRARMRMSQAALASELEVDVSTVKRWERGDQLLPRVWCLALDTLQLDLA